MRCILILLLVALTSVLVAGCGGPHVRPASKTPVSSACSAVSSNESEEGETDRNTQPPPREYWLGSNLSLKIWDSSAHPHFAFFEGYKEAYTEPVGSAENVNLLVQTSQRFLFEDEHSDHPRNLIPSVEAGTKLDAVPPTRTPVVRLTSRAVPDIVLVRETDSGFCYSIFEVSKSFPKLGTIKTKSKMVLESFGNDRVSKFCVSDFLPDFGIEAVAPTVIFHFANGKFSLDRKLMFKQRISQSDEVQWRRNHAKLFRATDEDVPVELSGVVFDYVYCGKAKEARAFVDLCWPRRRRGKKAYWRFVRDAIKKSPYYSDILSANANRI